jgi:hypothetical protein
VPRANQTKSGFAAHAQASRPLRSTMVTLPRFDLMTPFVFSPWTSVVTVVRRTPSICARNSCVRGTLSLWIRSALCSSQRQRRDEVS